MFPEIGLEIEKVSRGDIFEAELNGAGGGDADRESIVRNALRLHASRLAELNGVGLSDEDMDSVDALALARQNIFTTMQEKREAFRAVEDFVADRHDLEIDPEAAEYSRRRAREDTTAPLIAADFALGFATELPGGPKTPDEYFLDSEFVAIYW